MGMIPFKQYISESSSWKKLEFKADPKSFVSSPTKKWTLIDDEKDHLRHITGIRIKKNSNNSWWSVYTPNGNFDDLVGRNKKDAQTNALKFAVKSIDEYDELKK